MSIDERISDALFDYCIAWRDRASAVQDKVEAELRAAVEQHVAEAVARERDECARVCDDIRAYRPTTGAGGLIAEECAAAIRARAEHEEAK